jgi:hypothetical protein
MRFQLPISLRGARPLALAVLALASACSSTNPYVENRAILDKACSELQAGNYQSAAQQAEQLYAGRAEQAAEFRLQRYYAAYLTAQAHIQAALHKPFLVEAAGSGSARGLTTSENAPSTGAVPSATSHWVAASYYSGYARDGFEAAASAPQKEGDENLLPQALRRLDIRQAQANLDLTRLAILRRLGFDSECAGFLDASADLLDIVKCQAAIDQAELPNELRPWVFYAGFAYLRARSNPAESREQDLAYKLGAKARVLANSNPGSFPDAQRDEIVNWVKDHPKFVFLCPANHEYQSNLLACEQCGESITSAQLRSRK